MISVNSSNSFSECDNLFLPDFVKLDKIISKLEKRKQQDLELLMENLGGI